MKARTDTEFISYFLFKSRRWSKLLRRHVMSSIKGTCSGAFLVPFSILKGNFSSRRNFQRHTSKCSKTEKYRVTRILSRLISPCICHSRVHPCSSCHLLGHPLQQSQKLQIDGSALPPCSGVFLVRAQIQHCTHRENYNLFLHS